MELPEAKARFMLIVGTVVEATTLLVTVLAGREVLAGGAVCRFPFPIVRREFCLYSDSL